MLKVREDELVADMRQQLAIGYADMKQRTVEAAELSRTAHRREDRQHFVGALADCMNEVTRLRNKHLDYDAWVDDEGYYKVGE